MFFFFCVHVVFSVVSAVPDAFVDHHSHLNKNASIIFAGLLGNVIKINKMRLDAINQLSKLQEIGVNGLDLRSTDGDDRKASVILILGNVVAKHLLSTTKGTWRNVFIKPSEVSTENTEESSEDLSLIGRRRSEIFCVKTASKLCRKSCITSIKDGCSSLKCSSRMKKRAKTACKRSCKREFNRGKYEDTDTE